MPHLPRPRTVAVLAPILAAAALALPASALASAGIATPSVSSINFGTSVPDAGWGADPQQELTITNTGSAILHLGIPTISGPWYFGWTESTGTWCVDATLSPGDSCNMSVYFSAGSPADVSFSGTLLIPSDGTDPSLSIPLSASTITQAMLVSPAVSLGSVSWGHTATGTVTVTNEGQAPSPVIVSAEWNADTLYGTVPSSEESVVPGTDTCLDTSLPGGASCTVEVSVTPEEDLPIGTVLLGFYSAGGELYAAAIQFNAGPATTTTFGPGTTGTTGPTTTTTSPSTQKPSKSPAPQQAPTVSLTHGTAGGLTEVRGAKSDSKAATATVTLSAPGTVKAVIAEHRHGQWRSVKSITVNATKAGAVSIPLRDPTLRPGLYRVSVTVDAAGKISDAQHFSLHVAVARHH